MIFQAVFDTGRKSDSPINNIAQLAQAYLDHVDQHYVGHNGELTKEPANIRYSLNVLVEMCATVP
ncbi:MAG TPA: hypothetical protein PLP05_10615 [Sedimentisphaerales bacterium]|nr:hypothetical protein [Sedimentisphaerales bacterium]